MYKILRCCNCIWNEIQSIVAVTFKDVRTTSPAKQRSVRTAGLPRWNMLNCSSVPLHWFWHLVRRTPSWASFPVLVRHNHHLLWLESVRLHREVTEIRPTFGIGFNQFSHSLDVVHSHKNIMKKITIVNIVESRLKVTATLPCVFQCFKMRMVTINQWYSTIPIIKNAFTMTSLNKECYCHQADFSKY